MYVITFDGNHCEAFVTRLEADTFLGWNEYRAADGWSIVEVNAEPV